MPDVLEQWFASKGWRPFDFQRQTWQAYRSGASGLVHAPTGMGKSYAVWLGPLVEWLDEAPTASRRPPALRVLWITPLRALAKDTHQSLLAPIEALGLPWTVELRTGDTSASLRRRQRERLPTALVTTPESLTLLLSYPDTQERMRDLRCVVVDEWHELLGTKRGVQTELALARLRRWVPGLRTWGLSATLGNLHEAMAVLVGRAGGGAARLVSADATRDVQLETLVPADMERFGWAGHLGIRLLPEVLAALGRCRSTLLFTNTRSQAELWFQSILRARPDWIGQVALHHGSLDREIREQVEQMLRAGTLRCVVCTSSLDLGVDFPAVDQVIQVGSAKGIGRLLQRAGRSHHRPGATSRVVCVPTHAFELVEFAAARRMLAPRPRVEPRPPVDKPLDVLAQHLVTIGLGGGFREEDLLAEVRTTHAYGGLTDPEWRWTMDFVTRGGPALQAYPQYARLVEQEGCWRVPPGRTAQVHRLSIGTITSESQVNVRYLKGGSLGVLEESFIGRLQPGDCFVFAGRVLELVMVEGMTAYARKAAQATGLVPKWTGGRQPLSAELAGAVRHQLAAARRGRFDGPEMQRVRPVLEIQAAWSQVPAADELLVERLTSREGEHLLVYPFEGRFVHEGLAALLAWRLAQRRPLSISVTANDYGLHMLVSAPLGLDEPQWRRLLSRENLERHVQECLRAVELMRRQFRDIARIAGLVFSGYPGQMRQARHLQASAELFFEVFREHDPGNLLLEQARREVLRQQLHLERMAAALERIERARLVLVEPPQLTPLGFPIWAEHVHAQVSSERWLDSVQRMALKLEEAAAGNGRGRRAARAAHRVG